MTIVLPIFRPASRKLVQRIDGQTSGTAGILETMREFFADGEAGVAYSAAAADLDAAAVWWDSYPGTLYAGLDGAFDHIVDANTGSDANDGSSEAAAWRTLRKIDASLLRAGRTIRVLVKTGLYDDARDSIDLSNNSVEGAELEIVFEGGCIMDGTAANATASANGFEFNGIATWSATIQGNGLIVRNYTRPNSDSPNGVGNRNTHHLTVHDVHCDNCDDGFAAHGAARMVTWDCTAQNASKSAFVHVDTAVVEHHRCYFRIRGLSNGYGSGTPAISLHDCLLEPETTGGDALQMKGVTARRCQIGTTSKRVDMLNAGGLIEDSFINIYADGTRPQTYRRCFGRLSTRVRGPGGAVVENCVLAAPASGKTNIIFSNFDGGLDCALRFERNVILTTSLSSVDVTNAGYLANGGALFDGNNLWNGATWDPDLLAAGVDIRNDIVSDPQVGTAAGYAMADYASAAGLAGFLPAEAAEREPRVLSGLSGTPFDTLEEAFLAQFPTWPFFRDAAATIPAREGEAVARVEAVAGAPGGIPAVQDDPALQPIVQRSAQGAYLKGDGTDRLVVDLPDLGTNATLAWRSTDGAWSFLTAQTFGGSTELTPQAWSDLLVIDRELLSSEIARLESAGR